VRALRRIGLRRGEIAQEGSSTLVAEQRHEDFGDGAHPRHAVTNGLLAAAAIAGSMFFGLVPDLQHWAARLPLWRREKVPLDLPDFLSTAATKPFLKRVGAGYCFVAKACANTSSRGGASCTRASMEVPEVEQIQPNEGAIGAIRR
jgi:hypothetical protein